MLTKMLKITKISIHSLKWDNVLSQFFGSNKGGMLKKATLELVVAVRREESGYRLGS